MDTNTLVQIYNTLGTIDTHGDGTMKMAACLDALAKVINEVSKAEGVEVTTTPPETETADDTEEAK